MTRKEKQDRLKQHIKNLEEILRFIEEKEWTEGKFSAETVNAACDELFTIVVPEE